MIGGCALLTLNDAVIKWLSAGYPLGQILFLRGLFACLPMAVLAWRAGGLRTLRVVSWRWQSLRMLLTLFSTLLFVTSLKYMPLAEATALTFASPLFLVALAPFTLKERVGIGRWAVVLLGFGGVLLMLRPGTEAMRWIALLPLLVALSEALRDLITRKMIGTETSLSMMNLSTLVVMFAGLGSSVLGWPSITPIDLGLMVLAGLLLGGAHFFMIEAFRFSEAAMLSPLRYSALVWAVLFGFLVWRDIPDTWASIGGLLIVVSGLFALRAR